MTIVLYILLKNGLIAGSAVAFTIEVNALEALIFGGQAGASLLLPNYAKGMNWEQKMNGLFIN